MYRNRLSASQAPRALLAAAAFGAASLTVAVPSAAAELACAAPQSVPIETVRTIPPPTIDNSLTQPQLQLLAEHRHPGRALGLYHAYVNGRFNARIQMRWDEGEACLWVARIALRIESTDRRIWVIRERHPGTCAYDVVLEHERKHQQVDEEVVAAFMPKLEKALAHRVAALGVVRVPAGEREAAQKRMLTAVNETFQAQMHALQEERERRQQEVDTPAEYRRIGAACDPLRDKK